MRALAVVDASVSLKWVLDDEEHVDEALALRNRWIRGRLELVAPTLWFYEILNGLVMAVQTGRISAQDSLEGWADLAALGLPLADPPAEQIHGQALASGLTAYDAAYVSLARQLDATLWTGDRQLYQATARSGLAAHWIGDFEVPP